MPDAVSRTPVPMPASGAREVTPRRCAVIGGGAWGTAIADRLARNGHHTVLWAREDDVVTAVNTTHENPRFLAGIPLAPSLEARGAINEALRDADLVVYAAPSHVLRVVVANCAAHTPRHAVLSVATKGIERETLALMTDVVAEASPGHPVVAVSGPSFAAEVAMGQPTAVVAASVDHTAATLVQGALSAAAFRVYTSDDVVGVELGGALKNVMAVATGILDGLGLGFNPRAALLTRGLAEMTRLGVALGAQPDTFAGLAGLGDLVLTCTGALSRNRAVGVAIGQGQSLEQALAGKDSVAEGVLNTQSARALAAKTGVEMPIVEATHRILFEGCAPRDAVAELMARELRPERD
ncbi:MAG: NAD(P)-dependent glycerol-3-phosphate dehydrogenase [Gemmatimonas sp.]|jgi:glycerol-3-phosphate dehydrogenase (NAD(P)+)|nr:NAD(P)H-dependent glycerol-3-phosphate dehydrogenase [Gemmatimonas sp.]MCE2952462.1 NAD(P)-dependent glycerol-3-phosphate dehydrogenase [Gemmatimonas sp.]MCZ8013995.1 NAD(P)-dependent glycerol-3-phosphate dehydrogenase [Gemmatimonas sp.]MCZ8265243.1 NAD(P)-dependent glycerol-3-phosphate dehydrogenase [Gemmatimonas sp.]